MSTENSLAHRGAPEPDKQPMPGSSALCLSRQLSLLLWNKGSGAGKQQGKQFSKQVKVIWRLRP